MRIINTPLALLPNIKALDCIPRSIIPGQVELTPAIIESLEKRAEDFENAVEVKPTRLDLRLVDISLYNGIKYLL